MRVRRAVTPLLVVSAIVLAATACGPVSDGSADPAPAAAATATRTAERTPSPSPTHHLRVVTLGDSLMSGYGLSSGQAWPKLLAASAGLSVTNLACGGMGFVVSGDCQTAYAGLVPAVIALQPELIIIQSSDNDFDLSAEDVAEATASTVEQLRDAVPDAELVGLSTISYDDGGDDSDVAMTSAALQTAVESVGGTFLDIGQPLTGHAEWMQGDDEHPNKDGQRVIAATVHEALIEAGILP